MFKELDPVALIRDLPEYGRRTGDLGAVVHVHEPDWVEVEFVSASGDTEAVVSIHVANLRPVDRADLVSVRRIRRSA